METSPEPTKMGRYYNRSAIWSFSLGLVALSIPLLIILLINDESDVAIYIFFYSLLCSIPFVLFCLIVGIVSLRQIKWEKQTHAGKFGDKGTWMAVIGLVLGFLEAVFLLFMIPSIS